eukprot:1161830-Pelagomonas_calceolata.AAC.5
MDWNPSARPAFPRFPLQDLQGLPAQEHSGQLDLSCLHLGAPTHLGQRLTHTNPQACSLHAFLQQANAASDPLLAALVLQAGWGPQLPLVQMTKRVVLPGAPAHFLCARGPRMRSCILQSCLSECMKGIDLGRMHIPELQESY